MEIRHHLEPSERSAVTELLAVAEAADGRRPLADHKWLDLVHGGRTGFTALLHRRPDGTLDGYAQLTAGHGACGLETVVHPEVRGRDPQVEPALVASAVTEVAHQGGGRLYYWMAEPSPDRVAAATSAGFAPGRELWQMVVPLPLPARLYRDLPPLHLRPFRPGIDEEAWIAVNNRAFADHPEQGGWDLAALAEREAEDWFDPEGFLVAEDDGAITGSCWTKMHAGRLPLTGEIYVISVDPARHHRGLGRALTVAGLDWLNRHDATVGMLYVDADNQSAVRLYRALGFTVAHVDRAFVLDVPAAPAAGDDAGPGEDPQAPEIPTARPMP